MRCACDSTFPSGVCAPAELFCVAHSMCPSTVLGILTNTYTSGLRAFFMLYDMNGFFFFTPALIYYTYF